MENSTTPNKLDETVKESLSNYDAKYDTGDWARMERMLDSTPKSSVTKGSYNKAIVIGAVVIAGGFLIFKGITSSKNTPETTIAPIENKTENTTEITTKPAPVIIKEIKPVAPFIKKETTVVPEKVIIPEKTTILVTPDKTVAEKTKKEKEKKQKAAEIEKELQKNQKIMVMGNEPIFGDMIDSSKGVIHQTKEKESIKKAAVSKGANNIGLSGLLNLNADSIRKQKEMLQKDTLHK